MLRRTYLLHLGLLTSLAGCSTLDRPVGPRSVDATPTGAGDPSTGPTDDGRSSPGQSTPTSTPDDHGFSNVLDAVDDLGCDSTGGTSSHRQLREAVASDTLIRFPPGTYYFNSFVPIKGHDRIGFLGDGDVRFVPRDGFNGTLLNVSEIGSVLFKGIDIDIRAADTTAGLRFIAEKSFLVEDVEFVGRGNHPDANVTHALFLAVMDRTGVGIARRVVAKHGSAIGHYKGGDGRGGIWVGQQHRGTARIIDCRFEEFGNNGMYASRTPGKVQVEGGLFRNNNVSQIRLSGEGSYVQDATIVVDLAQYSGPRTDMDSSFNTRGVMVEQGPVEKSNGTEVRHCDISIVNSPLSKGAIVVEPTGQTLTVRDTRIRVDEDFIPAVRRSQLVKQGSQDPAKPPHWIHLDNVEITGRARGGEAVLLADAPGSRLTNCRIDQRGRNRNGIRVLRSSGVTIEDTTIAATHFPLLFEFSGEATETEVCLVADIGLESDVSGPTRTLTDRDESLLDTGERCFLLAPPDDTVGRVGVGVTHLNGGNLHGTIVSLESPTESA